MRYQLYRELGGVLAVVPASGGQAPDGTLFDAPEQQTFIKAGESALGQTWEKISSAATTPGYIDA